MASLTLKSLPPALHRELKARAARHKRSLNQEVILVLEQAIAPTRRVDVEALLERARKHRESLSGVYLTPEEIDRRKREGRA